MTSKEEQFPGQRHSSKLRAFVLTLTRDEERARDLLQEVSYRTLKHRKAFRVGTKFVAWVRTIIRNVFISGYRQRQRRHKLRRRDQLGVSWSGDRVITNPTESSMAAEEIMATVGRLPETCRRAFMLPYQGMKYKDIARITGVPPRTYAVMAFQDLNKNGPPQQEFYWFTEGAPGGLQHEMTIPAYVHQVFRDTCRPATYHRS